MAILSDSKMLKKNKNNNIIILALLVDFNNFMTVGSDHLLPNYETHINLMFQKSDISWGHEVNDLNAMESPSPMVLHTILFT